MAYELIKKHTKKNYTNKTTDKDYIVMHYTGNKTDTAKANADYFYSTYRGVSAHFFVDDTTVYEVVDPDKVAWAVGKNYGSNNLFNTVKNSNSIQIEMCSRGGKITDATYENAVLLTKKLMSAYGIPADHVYRHYDVCSKQCPGWPGWTGKDTSIWQQFKKDIGSTTTSKPAATTSTSTTTTSKPATSTASKPAATTAKSNEITVDGQWGPATTKAAQKVFGTTQDGIVSKQIAKYKSYMPNCLASSWDFRTSGYNGGSQLIKAIQKWCGASADGLCGPGTIKALQAKLGVTADGIMGPNTVKAFQTYLNKYL